MKQTAVDYFNDALDDILQLYPSEWIEIQKIFEQAKAMEKEQLIEAHKSGQHYANNFEVPHEEDSVRYYNETFKSE